MNATCSCRVKTMEPALITMVLMHVHAKKGGRETIAKMVQFLFQLINVVLKVKFEAFFIKFTFLCKN